MIIFFGKRSSFKGNTGNGLDLKVKVWQVTSNRAIDHIFTEAMYSEKAWIIANPKNLFQETELGTRI